MRIPGSHPLVMGLIDQLGLERRPFRYVDTDTDGTPVNRTWIRVNGVPARKADHANNPRAVNRSFGVPAEYESVAAAEIVRRALDPVRDEFSTRRSDGTRVNKSAVRSALEVHAG
jgi:monoamine oxidase